VLVPFIVLNREGLVVLVLREKGRQRADHPRHATRMGGVLARDRRVLPG